MWKVGETRAHLEGTRVPGSEGLNPLGMDLKDSNWPHCWMGRWGFRWIEERIWGWSPKADVAISSLRVISSKNEQVGLKSLLGRACKVRSPLVVLTLHVNMLHHHQVTYRGCWQLRAHENWESQQRQECSWKEASLPLETGHRSGHYDS